MGLVADIKKKLKETFGVDDAELKGKNKEDLEKLLEEKEKDAGGDGSGEEEEEEIAEDVVKAGGVDPDVLDGITEEDLVKAAKELLLVGTAKINRMAEKGEKQPLLLMGIVRGLRTSMLALNFNNGTVEGLDQLNKQQAKDRGIGKVVSHAKSTPPSKVEAIEKELELEPARKVGEVTKSKVREEEEDAKEANEQNDALIEKLRGSTIAELADKGEQQLRAIAKIIANSGVDVELPEEGTAEEIAKHIADALKK